MQGVSQLAHWQGKALPPRDHALCENRHNPLAPHVTSYIGKRFKISVYRTEAHGEIFDLESDPGEVNNLWTGPGSTRLRATLLQKMVQAIQAAEPLKSPRVAQA